MLHCNICRAAVFLALIINVKPQANEIQCGNCDNVNANGEPGCDVEEIEQCVCMLDPRCCTEQWGAKCADLVQQPVCNFVCLEPESEEPECGDCGIGKAAGETGCDIDEVEQCVCDLSGPYCCETHWDDFCANKAQTTCKTYCTVSDGNNNPCGDCDTAKPPGQVGCDVEDIEHCVCGQDPWCCDEEMGHWDAVCVYRVEHTCNFTCGSSAYPGTQCEQPPFAASGSYFGGFGMITCSAITPSWSYNPEVGECQYWEVCTPGNDNWFETQEACEEACVE